MRATTLPGARRRETAETVRRRLPAVLPATARRAALPGGETLRPHLLPEHPSARPAPIGEPTAGVQPPAGSAAPYEDRAAPTEGPPYPQRPGPGFGPGPGPGLRPGSDLGPDLGPGSERPGPGLLRWVAPGEGMLGGQGLGGRLADRPAQALSWAESSRDGEPLPGRGLGDGLAEGPGEASPRAAEPPPAALPPKGQGQAASSTARLLSRWAVGAPELDRRAVAGLLVLLVLAVGYGVQHFWLGRPRQVPVPVAVAPAARPGPTPQAADLPATAGEEGIPRPSPGPAAVVVVDVAGKVRHPGLRTLPRGSRVADALRAAGGPLHQVDTTGLNLARVLADGEQILVGAAGAGTQPVGGTAGPSTAPVSLNAATVDQLDALPGVGPVLARHIIDYRDSHGGFTAVDQLRQVAGIGDRKLADIRPLVTL